MSYISAIRSKDEVLVWERNNGIRELKKYKAPYYFYVEDEAGDHDSIFGHKLSKLTFTNFTDFRQSRMNYESSGLTVYEANIPSEVKVLSSVYHDKPAPTLHMTLYDIEVDYDPLLGFSSPENPYAPINALALHHYHSNTMKVVAIPSPGFINITEAELIEAMNEVCPLPDDCKLSIQLFKTEAELLKWFLAEIADSDLISGWNEALFDRPYIAARILRVLGRAAWKSLSFPEAADPRERDVEVFGRINKTIDLSGRIGVDYLLLFKKYSTVDRQSYKLETVAEEVLPHLHKLEYEGSLRDLYYKNFPKFVRYNLRDTEILKGFEKKLGYLALANEMVHGSSCTFESVTGTLKLAEFAIINYCHTDLNKKVADRPYGVEMEAGIDGAYVLEPKVGMHKNIGSIDINSLYPSVIMAVNISPETIVAQFDEKNSAVDEIYNETDRDLTLRFFESDTFKTLPAKKWKEVLQQRKLSISGYGTVFTQDQLGIIPSILDKWFKTRKHYQKLKKDAEMEAAAILKKYQ